MTEQTGPLIDNGVFPPMDDELSLMYDKSIPNFYANQISAMASIHDIRLTFGLHSPVGHAAHVANVYLSFVAAKQLHDILGGIIADYESTVGPIPSILEPTR
jgi:hypothetical protein